MTESIATTRVLPETDAVYLAASSLTAFILGWCYTLPGPDDDAVGPRLCQPWSGVLDLLDTIRTDRRVLGLKSRKLGFTTAGLNAALWVAMFQSFSRAHLFSYRDDAAVDLIRRVRFTWARLPDALRLPLVEDNDHTLVFDGSGRTGDPDDRRVIKAYPTTAEASADESCDLALIDEAARIRDLHELYAAVEPTVRQYLVVISSGRGPTGDFVEMWNAAQAGTSGLTPRFYPWSARPDRSEQWRAEKLGSYTLREIGAREYPDTPDDAFLGLADYVFAGWAVDRAHNGAWGVLGGPQDGRIYATAWDIGKVRDAAVGTVLDITERPYQIVAWERHLGLPYMVLQQRIESLYLKWGGQLYVESNGPGEVIVDNLAVPAIGTLTSPKSKVEMISKLAVYLENGWIKWAGLPQLDREMRGYQWDDRALVQDAVMSLAIVLHQAPSGDILGIG